MEAVPTTDDNNAPSAAAAGGNVAISVQGVGKTFAIPAATPETLRGRLRHPFRRLHQEQLTALEEISFEVFEGEFFGIAGGNGSGKSTLLQILANVYKADAGTVWIAPRVAPIISLGIGFQQDLPALPNVLLTAELLGVPGSEVRRKFDEIIAFAELEEFANLRLRNYSSGMKVRLAFAVVMLVDADVLLFDEVFAVGDAVFRTKATQAFESLRKDKTVVFVTHNMSLLQGYCERAMLLNRGRMELVGEATAVARRYAELALEDHGHASDLPPVANRAATKLRAVIDELWLAGADGERASSVPPGEALVLHATIEATERIRQPGLRFEIRRRSGPRIFAPPTLRLTEGSRGIRAGGRLHVETAIENRLTPGPYTVVCAVTAKRENGELSVSEAQTIDFAVTAGQAESYGIVDLEHRVRVRRRGRNRPRRPASGDEER